MMDDLFIVLVMISIPVALFLLLLIMPFHLSLKICKGGPSITGFYRIAWLGLTLRRGTIYPPPPEGLSQERVRENGEEEEMQGRGQMRPPDLRSLLDAFPSIVGVLRSVIQSIKFEKVSCFIFFGLEDPVETAVLSGYLWSVLSALGLHRANILVEPYFGGARLEGDFRAELQTRMLWTLVVVIRALGDKKIRKLMCEAARGMRA